jgi:hypothetical protein
LTFRFGLSLRRSGEPSTFQALSEPRFIRIRPQAEALDWRPDDDSWGIAPTRSMLRSFILCEIVEQPHDHRVVAPQQLGIVGKAFGYIYRCIQHHGIVPKVRIPIAFASLELLDDNVRCWMVPQSSGASIGPPLNIRAGLFDIAACAGESKSRIMSFDGKPKTSPTYLTFCSAVALQLYVSSNCHVPCLSMKTP